MKLPKCTNFREDLISRISAKFAKFAKISEKFVHLRYSTHGMKIQAIQNLVMTPYFHNGTSISVFCNFCQLWLVIVSQDFILRKKLEVFIRF